MAVREKLGIGCAEIWEGEQPNRSLMLLMQFCFQCLADVELEEIDKYSALVFSPLAGDGQEAECSRAELATLSMRLANTRSVLKVEIPDFDQVCRPRVSYDCSADLK